MYFLRQRSVGVGDWKTKAVAYEVAIVPSKENLKLSRPDQEWNPVHSHSPHPVFHRLVVRPAYVQLVIFNTTCKPRQLWKGFSNSDILCVSQLCSNAVLIEPKENAAWIEEWDPIRSIILRMVICANLCGPL